ncbi:MAG: aminotransferase class I/II-fold pyridoxal phosphate-dependent enzyme [Acidimicrobiales bacterium]|nr:aminotransferase class I/II-fold pyridoxal phosphate-dependent enzyme [Acidimicrobiales bacterium]
MGRRQGTDAATLMRHFGSDRDLLPLWIAEPEIALAEPIVDALRRRAADGWYGYETRPEPVIDAYWDWTQSRHGLGPSGLHTKVSPSIGTSVGTLIELLTDPGDGVILQSPVFTDFKTIIGAGGRSVVKNSLLESDGGYTFDLEDLAAKAAESRNRLLILCSPHNPVGRVWAESELHDVAAICAEHDVFVLADEIHEDLALSPHRFVPFGTAAAGTDVRWASTNGPIKTFGLAGVCDTLLITPDDEVAERFQERSSQLHLTRNNVFGIEAFEVAYRLGGDWLDELLVLLAANVEVLRSTLPAEVKLMPLEGTYLAWLDLRELGLDVPEIPRWLAAEAGIAISPGHWFGREGAGFARMTIAMPTETITQAATQIRDAVARR